MKKSVPAANPEAFVEALTGWRRQRVEELRASIDAAARLEEVIKWGNLVYLSNGPVLLIRAEAERLLLGFWRGQRLRRVEPRLRPGGKYEMASIPLLERDFIEPVIVQRLVRAAVKLNQELGDPTHAGRSV